MASSIEALVETYVRAWCERDPLRRARLIEQCFAPEGRVVTRRRVIRGRAELAAAIGRFHATYRLQHIRRLSPIDTGDSTFRVRGLAEFHDGSSAESFDAGEVGADGRITLVLTFDGPLADAQASEPLSPREE